MARNEYVKIFKRRREGKTDYKKRRSLVQSKRPLLSVRSSNRYIYGQVTKPSVKGDLTLCSASSRELGKYGWNGSTKNLPSAYLTGYILGGLAKKMEIASPVVYSGISRFVHGSRIAAFLSGAREAGLKVDLDEEILPDEERLKGKHIADYAAKLSTEESDKYKQFFSGLLSKGLRPESYPEHFDTVVSKLRSDGSKF